MKHQSLQTLKNLSFTNFSPERLAYYAYALDCLSFPTSVNDGEFQRRVAFLCNLKLQELHKEIDRRIAENGDDTSMALISRLCGDQQSFYNSACEYFSLPTTSRSKKRILKAFSILLANLDYSHMSDSELVKLHALSPLWYDLRRYKEMETFTREYFWRIADAITDTTLAQVFLLTEYIEADNYSHAVSLTYNIGERLVPFIPSAYPDDAALIKHIKALSEEPTYLSRNELIGMADYIQTEIVETGKTAEHLQLVNAILNTGMPCFNYPKIAKELEKTTVRLAKSNSKSRIELAPVYNTLWSLTLKSSYLNQFEKIVRHCYFTLANDKTYPGLGVDTEDSRSLATAVKFLDENRKTLLILNERYDMDKVIQKYRTTLCRQNQKLHQGIETK